MPRGDLVKAGMMMRRIRNVVGDHCMNVKRSVERDREDQALLARGQWVDRVQRRGNAEMVLMGKAELKEKGGAV